MKILSNILLGKNTTKHANYNYLRVKLTAQIFKLLSKTQDFSVLTRNMKRQKKIQRKLQCLFPLNTLTFIVKLIFTKNLLITEIAE